eukprot:jgi/Bigna1/86172/estExt_fgenesh1_pg.C_80239
MVFDNLHCVRSILLLFLVAAIYPCHGWSMFSSAQDVVADSHQDTEKQPTTISLTCSDDTCPWSAEDDPAKLKDHLNQMQSQLKNLSQKLHPNGVSMDSPDYMSEEERYAEIREKELQEGLNLLSKELNLHSHSIRKNSFPTNFYRFYMSQSAFDEHKSLLLSNQTSLIIIIRDIGVDALELMKMFYTMFHKKEKQKPIFLVTFGPPGSGKSWILEMVARHYNYDLEANFIRVLQDDMMKSMSAYNKAMEELGDRRSSFIDEKGELKAAFYGEANNIYWKYRNMVIQMKKMLLDIAYKQELNIVYETTGSKRADNPKQTLFNIMNEARARRYKIVIIYPYVKNETLVDRLNERNKKQNRVLKPSALGNFVGKAQSNFLHYLEYADAGYLYDNNIDKSDFDEKSKDLPWLMKYHRNGERRDYKCHPNICKYGVWQRLIDGRSQITVCEETCAT